MYLLPRSSWFNDLLRHEKLVLFLLLRDGQIQDVFIVTQTLRLRSTSHSLLLSTEWSWSHWMVYTTLLQNNWAHISKHTEPKLVLPSKMCDYMNDSNSWARKRMVNWQSADAATICTCLPCMNHLKVSCIPRRRFLSLLGSIRF